MILRWQYSNQPRISDIVDCTFCIEERNEALCAFSLLHSLLFTSESM